jgi:phosphoserine phosphatase
MNREITSAELLSRLNEELCHVSGPAAMVFDADGTLWSGDVGDDLFFYATDRNLLRDEARGALIELAATHGLDTRSTTSELAVSLHEAEAAGRFPERALYEMMAWCFAGLRLEELADIARNALADADLDSRLFAPLMPVLDWAREAEVETAMITASPQPIAELAGAECGFLAEQIIACRPLVRDGVIQTALAARIPYGSEKAQAGRRHLGDSVWLAAFGDSGFDFDMLALARMPVAVCPKPELLTALSALGRAFVLE